MAATTKGRGPRGSVADDAELFSFRAFRERSASAALPLNTNDSLPASDGHKR